ncbi:cyclic nucleotide-binding domain-containing protein [Carboxydothermus hydrogenoformans]|uniref:cyclic nucleotide-binding domain-containing protein n=1 Tax=Carboxydothermus hydrogenoformans TaxID=129958 RepID=UPI0009FECDCD
MKRCLLCLKELPIFQGLDLPEFVNVCLSTSKKRVSKESFLFCQGDPVNTVYLIKAGKFKLVQVTDEGRKIIFDVIGPGEVLGETALFHNPQSLYNTYRYCIPPGRTAPDCGRTSKGNPGR